VPGFLDVERFADRVLAVPVVVTVEEEEVHRSHFQARSADSSARPFDRYLSNFDNIRRVQKYIKSQALSHDWPVIASYSLDQTIAAIIDLVVDRATERLGGQNAPMPEPVLELEGGKTR
jgi:2-phosphoglycerate kinase